MRILHVDSERPWRGGQNQILLLMRRQRGRGDEAHLVAPGDAVLAARASAEGIPVHAAGMRGTWDLGSVLGLARVMSGLRPDIVHWHAARAHAIGAMAALLVPGPARVVSRRVTFPVRRSPGSVLLWALPVDRVAAISNAVRDALVQSGVPAHIIDVVPSGVELPPAASPAARARVRAGLGCAEGEVAGIVVSALSEGKGHRDLLHAAAAALPRSPQLRLWIVGTGPLEKDLYEECRTLGLGSSVRFLGFREDVPELLGAADFFCLPSYSEGLGSSILEAMGAGLPVVATRVGGIPEVVEERASGILVRLSHPVELVDALVAITVAPELRSRMGCRGRERAALFTAGRTAEGTYGVYRSALRARGR
ncbi:MAG TPA: glycosyltransferase [Candidatus Dormibacteraeota bacterium]|nr:glycosyltransferase [Candidatus Dormibacteraeota bacterium]